MASSLKERRTKKERKKDRKEGGLFCGTGSVSEAPDAHDNIKVFATCRNTAARSVPWGRGGGLSLALKAAFVSLFHSRGATISCRTNVIHSNTRRLHAGPFSTAHCYHPHKQSKQIRGERMEECETNNFVLKILMLLQANHHHLFASI